MLENAQRLLLATTPFGVLSLKKKKKKNRTSKHKNTHSRAENNLGRRKLYFKYFKGPTVFKDNKLSLDKR